MLKNWKFYFFYFCHGEEKMDGFHWFAVFSQDHTENNETGPPCLAAGRRTQDSGSDSRCLPSWWYQQISRLVPFYPHSLVPVDFSTSADFCHLFLFLPENSDITVVCGTQYMDLSIYLCPIYHAFYNESLMVVNSEFNNPECFGTPVWNVDPPLLKFTFPINDSSISSCNNKFEVYILHYYFQCEGELRNLCVSFRIWGYYMVQVGYGIWLYYSWKLISCFSHQVINQAGTGQFSDFSNVQYVNISGVVNSIDPAAGMITYRPQILYKFSCLYPMQYLLNNTEMAVWVCHATHGWHLHNAWKVKFVLHLINFFFFS